MFICKDGGAVTLAIGSNKQFGGLCEALSVPGLAVDERFGTNPSRVANREACKALLSERIATVERDVLLDALHQRAVPAGAVNDMHAVFLQPQAEALVVRRGDEVIGVRQAAFSVDGDTRSELTLRAPPRYGEHTMEVLMQEAGLSADEAAVLVEAGVAHETGPRP